MIMKETYIGIYWGERNEGLESCANKVNATLKLLSSIDNSFKEWYKTTRPRKNEIVEQLSLICEVLYNVSDDYCFHLCIRLSIKNTFTLMNDKIFEQNKKL